MAVDQPELPGSIHKLKATYYRWMGRLVDWSNSWFSRMDPELEGRESFLAAIIRFTGDVALLLQEFPRVDVYQITLENIRIIFAGNRYGMALIKDLFDEKKSSEIQALNREYIWNLPKVTRSWLAQGDTLVVCELNRLALAAIKAPVAFTTPVWVTQSLELPDILDGYLSGKKFHEIRVKLNRCSRLGYSVRFSRVKADFELYYRQMYVPHAQKRFQELAYIQSYEELLDIFMKTGILMVEKDGIPVAGQMIKINRNIGQLVNVGILNGEETYIQSGILTYIVHHTILWFHGQGIRKVILGQSLAVFSDGPFQFKQKWEPRVTRPFEMIQPIWKFLMNDLPADLIEKINQMGIITEKKGKYYYLEICPEDELCNAENALPGTRRRVIQSLTGSSIVWRNNQNYQPY